MTAPRVHEMTFVNPVFHAGLNITVRHGDKWARLAQIGDHIQIPGRAGTIPIAGLLHRAELGDIPDAVLSLEHDAAARSHAGLRCILDDIYGPTDSGLRGVTVVFLDVPAPLASI